MSMKDEAAGSPTRILDNVPRHALDGPVGRIKAQKPEVGPNFHTSGCYDLYKREPEVFYNRNGPYVEAW